jgi:hypothetical protein
LIWNAIQPEHVEVLAKMTELRYDEQEYVGDEIQKLLDGREDVWTVRKQRKTSGSVDFLVRCHNVLGKSSSKTSIKAIRIAIAFTPKHAWKVTAHLSDSSFVATGKPTLNSGSERRTVLYMSQQVLRKPSDNRTGWRSCLSDGKEIMIIAPPIYDNDVIVNAEVYDSTVSSKNIATGDYIVYSDKDDGDKINFTYARVTKRLDDILTIDSSPSIRILASVVTPVLFVVHEDDSKEEIKVSCVLAGRTYAFRDLEDLYYEELKRLVSDDSLCVMISLIEEKKREFYNMLLRGRKRMRNGALICTNDETVDSDDHDENGTRHEEEEADIFESDTEADSDVRVHATSQDDESLEEAKEKAAEETAAKEIAAEESAAPEIEKGTSPDASELGKEDDASELGGEDDALEMPAEGRDIALIRRSSVSDIMQVITYHLDLKKRTDDDLLELSKQSNKLSKELEDLKTTQAEQNDALQRTNSLISDFEIRNKSILEQMKTLNIQKEQYSGGASLGAQMRDLLNARNVD